MLIFRGVNLHVNLQVKFQGGFVYDGDPVMKMGMIPTMVWETLLLISMMTAIRMMKANWMVMMIHNDTTQKAATHNL